MIPVYTYSNGKKGKNKTGWCPLHCSITCGGRGEDENKQCSWASLPPSTASSPPQTSLCCSSTASLLCTLHCSTNYRWPQRYRQGAIDLEGTLWNGICQRQIKRCQNNISHLRKSFPPKDWMGSISPSPIC